MSIVDKIKGVFGSGEPTYEYYCPNCDAEFESGQSRLVDVSCPECANTDVSRA